MTRFTARDAVSATLESMVERGDILAGKLAFASDGGIMVGDDQIQKAHANLPNLDPFSDHHLTTIITSIHNGEKIVDPIKADTFDWEQDGDCWRIVVFTDGSAFDGCGVYYTADNK